MTDSSHEQMLGRIDERTQRIETKLDDLHGTVHGNGDPGIKTRIDRLEQSRRGFVWWSRTLVSGAILSVIAAVVAMSATFRGN